MLQQERLQMIMEEIRRESAVTVTDMAEKLNVSESTIRRDIAYLDEIGDVKKVFGGAVSVEPGTQRRIIAGEKGMAEKSVLNVEEKRAIGKHAATLIQDGDFIFIDAGTTTGLLIENLTNKNATYVTNGIRHALRLAERGFTVYVLAGQAKYLTEVIAGALACENLSRYEFSKSFIGTNGIDAEMGFTTPDIEESMVKSEVIRRSEQAFVLADNTKFGMVSSVSFADIEDVTIITDKCTDNSYKGMTVIQEVSK